MWYAQVMLLTTLVSLVTAAPAPGGSTEALGSWTISDFRRLCPADINECRFSFLLTESTESEPVPCSFTVAGSEGQPAAKAGFAGARCTETDTYSINSGWDEAGFIVMTVNNNVRGLLSFFGFEDAELADGATALPKSRSVLRGQMAEQPVPDESPQGNDNEGLNYADEWTLTDVIRYTIADAGPPAMALTFRIEHIDHEPQTCVVMGFGQASQDPATMSFYGTKCALTNWAVSWGYDENAEEDVAVMTVMNEHQNRRAYFGFRQVNSQRNLGNNGPQRTYPY